MACICQKVPAKSAYTSISKANVKSHFLNSLLPGNVTATTKSQEVAAPGPETVSHVTPPTASCHFYTLLVVGIYQTRHNVLISEL